MGPNLINFANDRQVTRRTTKNKVSYPNFDSYKSQFGRTIFGVKLRGPTKIYRAREITDQLDMSWRLLVTISVTDS
jgi:hypothetical protein